MYYGFYGYNDGYMGLAWYEEDLEKELEEEKEQENGFKDDDGQGT